MIPCWIYQSSLCFQWSIPFSIGYNCLYQLGYLLMQFPIWYSHIISGSFMPVVYPWYPRVIGWVSTQPCFFYPLDILQGSSSWGCLPFSLINHFLCLILWIQLLYSLVGNWLVQFQCTVIVNPCFFFFHCPVLGGVLNLALSTVRAFQFSSNESLDTLVCIHHLLWNDTVSLSPDSLLMLCCGSLSASLCMVSLHFPCSMRGSGLSFQQKCLLAGLSSNCSIALFIISWNSLMNSSRLALQLTSDELSSSLVFSWSLACSWGSSSATSCWHAFPARLLDSPVTSCLSGDRHHGACSHVLGGVSSTHCGACSCVLGGVSSTLLSSVTVPVTVQTLCVPAVSPVGCPTVLTLLLNVATPPVSCLTVLTSLPNAVASLVSCLTVLALLPNAVGSPSIFSCSQLSAMFLHVAAHLVIFIIWYHWWLFTNATTIFQNTSKICYWSFIDMLFKPVSMSNAQLPVQYLGNTGLKCVLCKNCHRSDRSL